MKKEYCGLFGIYGYKDAASTTYLGLYALQHRGQESAGIVTSDGEKVSSHLGMGLVGDIFNSEILSNLKGHIAIGHVRYSTTGGSNIKNAQPFLVNYSRGYLAVGHNGNLINAERLKAELEAYGSIFQSTTDSEVIAHLIARSNERRFEDNLINALSQIKGAYSLILMTQDSIVGVRDPFGFKPLCLGEINGAYVLASETCALDLIQAKYIRDIEPGEILIINSKGLKSIKPFGVNKHSSCIFEYIYFARPDSKIFGASVYEARKKLGETLADEHPVDSADLVIPVPDSGTCAAIGYAEKSKIRFDMGFIRNHYIGRTFIQPHQIIRDFGVKIKLNPVREIIEGKTIVVVEDSIVRGTTSKARIRTLKDVGAKKIHMRISCPPIKHPCFFGIDFPTEEELIASSKSVDEIKKYIGVDSLGYLSIEGMLKSMPFNKCEFCTACFTGEYPVKPTDKISKRSLERGC